MSKTKIVVWSILGVVLIGLASWGAYELGWFLEAENTERQVQIDNNNSGTQTAWQDKVQNNIAKIETLGEGSPASRALTHEACEYAGKLTDQFFTRDIEDWYNTNC